MKFEIDLPEHQYNNIIALNSLSLGRVPYKGIIMYAINAIKNATPVDQEPNVRHCFGCKYSKDNHIAGTEECHLCMWENQYTPTTKNDIEVSSELEKNSKKLEKNFGESDCISRADVERAIEDVLQSDDCDYDLREFLADLVDIPSVTPIRSKGHWITRPHIYGVAFCSECGFELKINNTNYCPNCGADIRAESESQESED